MRRFLRENSLSLVMFALFFATAFGQSVTGHREFNDDARSHRQSAVSYVDYLTSGHFIEATFENWESEFLQMSAFVIFTVFLRQKGSPESKRLRGAEPVDADPRRSRRRDAAWPIRRGGLVLVAYENSLGIALFSLFLLSLLLHAAGGVAEFNREQLAHGESTVSFLRYLTTARFWFESFQNWQSEFLSVGALVVLAIFFRQLGSPESKPVDHPHAETGRE